MPKKQNQNFSRIVATRGEVLNEGTKVTTSTNRPSLTSKPAPSKNK